MKRLRFINFETGEESLVESSDVIAANFIKRDWLQDAGTANKVDAVIEALTAAANLLDEISDKDVKPTSRIAGLFAAQAIQLKQQIDTLESFIQ